jgi:hypothetical protein
LSSILSAFLPRFSKTIANVPNAFLESCVLSESHRFDNSTIISPK